MMLELLLTTVLLALPAMVQDWWQWLVNTNLQEPVIYDMTGLWTEKANDKEDNVFFLAGAYNHEATRNITIGTEDRLFFPAVMGGWSYKGTGIFSVFDFSEIELQKKNDMDKAANMTVLLDGNPIIYDRVSSGIFTMNYPEDNIIHRNAQGDLKTLVDGYWVLLQPMAEGNHTIFFKGTSPQYKTEVTYNVKVI